MKRFLRLFRRKPEVIKEAPDRHCVVGHKRYYRIMPWRMAK